MQNFSTELLVYCIQNGALVLYQDYQHLHMAKHAYILYREQKCVVNGIETFLIWKTLILQTRRHHGFVWGSAVSLPGLRPNPYSSVTG